MQNLHGPKISDAIDIVAREFNLPSSAIVGERGNYYVSYARQVAMWLARTSAHQASFEKIGRAFGNRNHATIMFGARKIERMRTADPLIAAATDRLVAQVMARAAARTPADVAAWRSLGGELRAA